MKKYKKTIIGSSLLLLLLLMSIFYPAYGPKDYNHQVLVKNEQGKIIGRAPFPPSESIYLELIAMVKICIGFCYMEQNSRSFLHLESPY
ncbi:hypothetical protein ABES02_25125 [Neobacillus pocheonensis]|uniref:hypothetical protein n=1 Tax=Neobacillus pocheonensis TaxID=363869 RepID=UPI003D2D6FD1